VVTVLPTWADNRDARRLLASIIADPPETRIRRDDWGSEEVYRTWKRPDVAALRKLHAQWQEREFAALDRKFAVTGVWSDAASKAVLGAETPDALIARLLGEAKRQEAA
jgi:hypothetical protein